MFEDFDFKGFWEQSRYADQEYVGDPLTAETVSAVEHALGYKLPKAYVEFMRRQNGGVPRKTCHRATATSWAADHVAITGLFSIGSARPSSLCGKFSSRFWSEEWGYPAIGIYFADCPSAGHDMLCLDYRECGVDGEPCVVHVDQEFDYRITLLVQNFESFVRGLESEEAFEDSV